LSQSADRPATSDDSRTTQQLTDALFQKMANATYTSVVWCSETLTIDHPDLWVERLWHSIAERNETSRCAGLAWASLNATFQQVCTWLTGFPGRIRFRNGLPEYDPNDYSTRVWLNNRDSMATTSASKPPMILYIDETVGQGNDFLHSLRKTNPGCSVIEISVNSKQFPTSVPGIETSADIFRADQCLLAHIDAGLDNENSSGHAGLRSAAQWLEGLHP
jgi:formylmethanofuran dehydrogenase subunit B